MDSISRRTFLEAVGIAALTACSPINKPQPAELASSPMDLQAGGWMMQSSAVARGSGDQLSRVDVPTSGWYAVEVPCTVMAGLIANGEYPDIFYSDNLRHVQRSRFAHSWWYRTQFFVPPEVGTGWWQLWLHFKGINYRANIWLNGELIADSKTAVGAYRDLELNITEFAVAGQN
ncbi:MAG TPA: hypothetical protein VMD30_07495, partial [Tepidisphaeraceae bacterium]|nr:hypothetical protein [Tepidisphaeraceae bacterium]